MRVLIAFSAILYFVHAAHINENVELWNEFKTTHKKTYLDKNEEFYRFGVFNHNLALINKHNEESSKGLHSYTLKMNQFGDMTNEEFAKTMLTGLKVPSETDRSKNSNRHKFNAPENFELPPSVDWREKGAVTTVIENQGQCGSCWAFTATGALEGQHFLKTGKLVELSAQNLMDCSGSFGNEGCNGGFMDSAFEYIKANKGVDTEASYPYEAKDGDCRFKRATVGATDTGYVDLPKGNETSLQIALATVGPISLAVDAGHTGFIYYSSGVYDDPQCTTTNIDHSFIVVGYGTFNNGTVKKDYYIAKNSWGDAWGMHGYIWMSRNKNDQCGIAQMASYPLV